MGGNQGHPEDEFPIEKLNSQLLFFDIKSTKRTRLICRPAPSISSKKAMLRRGWWQTKTEFPVGKSQRVGKRPSCRV
jgi:hypothetical protein